MAFFRCKNLGAEPGLDYIYKWDFTKSLVDEVEGKTAIFKGQNAEGIIRDNEGIHINNAYQAICLGNERISLHYNRTIEVEISEFDFNGTNSKNTSIISYSMGDNDTAGEELLYFKPGYGWSAYAPDSKGGTARTRTAYDGSLPLNAINNKTIKLKLFNEDYISFYLDDTLISTIRKYFDGSYNYLYLGGFNKYKGNWHNGNSYNMIIKSVKIYENEEV